MSMAEQQTRLLGLFLGRATKHLDDAVIEAILRHALVGRRIRHSRGLEMSAVNQGNRTMDDIERSGSGSPIYRHKARDREMRAPEDDGIHLEAIEAHLQEHVGKIETVYHEIVSDLIHLDILFLPANPEKPYHTLVTSGVSDRPMRVPEEMEDFSRTELMINLPTEWPLDQESLKEDANYWPIRWLKQIGRLPHDYDTWIGWGHTIPNGDPAEPIANSRFTGMMVSPPYWLGPDFFQLETGAGEKICFYNVIPLYQEEMDFKLAKSAEALEERFDKNGIGLIVDLDRKNVAKKKGWFRSRDEG